MSILNKAKVVDIFAGAGGDSLAAKNVGCDIVFAGSVTTRSDIWKTMNFTLQTVVNFPIRHGFLGFLLPCVVGGNFFMDIQKNCSRSGKVTAVLVFLAVRSSVARLFGGLIDIPVRI